MNARIEKLAELCTSSFVNMHGEWEDDFDRQKFAELLIQECLHIVDDEGAGEGGCIRAMIRIQDEFGVEA